MGFQTERRESVRRKSATVAENRVHVWRDSSHIWFARVPVQMEDWNTQSSLDEAARRAKHAIKVALEARDLMAADSGVGVMRIRTEDGFSTYQSTSTYEPPRLPRSSHRGIRVGGRARIVNNDYSPRHYYRIGTIIEVTEEHAPWSLDDRLYYTRGPVEEWEGNFTYSSQTINEFCLMPTEDPLTTIEEARNLS